MVHENMVNLEGWIFLVDHMYVRIYDRHRRLEKSEEEAAERSCR